MTFAIKVSPMLIPLTIIRLQGCVLLEITLRGSVLKSYYAADTHELKRILTTSFLMNRLTISRNSFSIIYAFIFQRAPLGSPLPVITCVPVYPVSQHVF